MGYVCEIWGPHEVDKHTFLGTFCCQLFSHISFSLPRLLQTAFELKTAPHTATNQAHTTALTENTINWLKLPKNIKICFRKFPNFLKNSKNANLEAYVYIYIYKQI